jgi:MFS superfamily sulfate permease-like transporter
MPDHSIAWQKDIPASLAVFFVALPLCLGIALASGAPMVSGLISGILGGILIGFLSGSHSSVSGPAAGMVAVVLSAQSTLGSFHVFSVALFLAGGFQVLAGWLKSGFIAGYIPKNIIQGLLVAIGLILMLKQIPHMVGLDKDFEGDFSFFQKDGENTFSEIIKSVYFFTPAALILSLVSIGILVLWDKTILSRFSFMPSSLFVVLLGIGFNAYLQTAFPDIAINKEHLVQIPAFGDLGSGLVFPNFSELLNPRVWWVAVTIAVVASLETLINIEATDNLDPYKRSSPNNRELMAQGAGNLVAGLIGGLPITSVVVRSAVNLQAGGRTRASAILHGVWLLVGFLLLARYLNLIPFASLAAILMVAGYKLAKIEIFQKMYRRGWSQFIPFLATVFAIVFTDLLTGVCVGSLVSLFFLMKSNLENPFARVEEKKTIGDTTHITFPNQVSFLHKAAIKEMLRDIPSKGKIIFDGSQTHFIDSDVVELLKDFIQNGAPARKILVNVFQMNPLGEHANQKQFSDVLSKENQKDLDPPSILQLLKEGNKRFTSGKPSAKFIRGQISDSSAQQNPMAVVISCIDSRTSPDLVFDAGLGDIVSIRIAGNIITREIAGSVEMACREMGVRLVVILGHSNCGAIMQSLELNQDGNIKFIFDEIQPSIEQAKIRKAESDPALVNQVAMLNLRRSVKKLRETSTWLSDYIEAGEVGMVAGFYNTQSGEIVFDTLEYSGTRSQYSSMDLQVDS